MLVLTNWVILLRARYKYNQEDQLIGLPLQEQEQLKF